MFFEIKVKIKELTKGLTIFILCIMLIINSSCQLQKNNVNNIFTQSDIKKMKDIMKTSLCKNGGYCKMPDDGNQTDLYSTYYAIKIKELINCPIENNYDIEIFNRYKNNFNNYFYNDKNYDNLSDLYFYVELCNKRIDTKQSVSICNYLKSLQSKQGYFYFSIKNKRNSGNNKNILPQAITSTLMATTILNKLDKKPDNSLVKNWMDRILKNKTLFDDNLRNCGYLVAVLEICENINYDYSMYNSYLKNKIRHYNQEFINSLLKHNEVSLINLKNIVDINILMNQKKELAFYKDLIYSNLVKKQNLNKVFSSELNQGFDIQFTYIGLYFMKEYNYTIPFSKEINDYIERFRSLNSGYVKILLIDSNVKDTYYVNKINELLDNSGGYFDDFMLDKTEKILNSRSEFRYYYISLLNKCKDNIVNYEIKKKLIDKTKNEIFNTDLSKGLQQYYNLYYNLCTMLEMNKNMDDSLRSFVIMNIEKNYNNKAYERNKEAQALKISLELNILKLLNYQAINYTNLNTISNYLTEYLNQDENYVNIQVLYFLVSSLTDNNIKIDKFKVFNYLNKIKNSNAFFVYKTEGPEIVSYQTQFYSLAIIKDLEH